MDEHEFMEKMLWSSLLFIASILLLGSVCRLLGMSISAESFIWYVGGIIVGWMLSGNGGDSDGR